MDDTSKQMRCVSGLIGAAVASIVCVPAVADKVNGVFCPQKQVMVPRDGVLLIQLDAQRHGTNWPATIHVRFGDGSRVSAIVAWRYAAGRPVNVHWTSPPFGLAVREIEPADDSSLSPNSPILIAPVPEGSTGDIRVLGKTIRAIWMDAPADPAGSFMDQPESPYPEDYLSLEVAPDRPDPDTPFEYWRWVLLASRYGVDPPAPRGSEVEQLVARYTADLWRMGLGRLAKATDQSRSAARDCRDLLTAICLDDNRPFASWLTNGDDLSYLLDLLLDQKRNGQELERDALAWVGARARMFFWSEGDDEEAIYLALVNAGHEDEVVRFRWQVTGGGAQIPISVEALAGRLTRVRLDRPKVDDRIVLRANLVVESENFRREFAVRPPRINAEPPGVDFGPLQPVLTLAEARATALRPAAADIATTATLRRIDGRWELFFECFRPSSERDAADSAALHELALITETPGIDAVSVFIGPADGPRLVFTVPEEGTPRVWVGGRDDALQLHRRSFGDRWYCRVVLRDEWLDLPTAEAAEFGFIRTHAGTNAFETSPDPCTPWSFAPGRASVGLQAWTDLPIHSTRPSGNVDR